MVALSVHQTVLVSQVMNLLTLLVHHVAPLTTDGITCTLLWLTPTLLSVFLIALTSINVMKQAVEVLVLTGTFVTVIPVTYIPIVDPIVLL